MTLFKSLITITAAMFFAGGVMAEGTTHDTNGRYQPVFNPPGGLWILDTHTGDVKICVITDGNMPPSCTAWTKNPS